MTESVFGSDEPTQIYVVINLVATIIGSVASILCILLIYRMKQVTGHIKLVLYLSYYQLIYDIFCFQNNADIDYYQKTFAIFVHIVTGLAGAFISNWIAFAAFYIVVYRNSFDVLKNIHLIHASCLIPGIINGIIYYVAALPEEDKDDELVDISILYAYNNIRIISIAVNFFFVIAILYKINQTSSRGKKTEQEIAIRALAHRIILYPVVQAIGRSGYAFYEYAYGADVSPSNNAPGAYGCLIFLSIITPTTSVGYLIIFLLMQPKAYDHFKAMICLRTYHEELRDNSLFQDDKTLSGKPSTASLHSALDSEGSERHTTVSTSNRESTPRMAANTAQDPCISSSTHLPNPSTFTASTLQSTPNNSHIRSTSTELPGSNRVSYLSGNIDELYYQRTDDELFDVLNRASLGMQFFNPAYRPSSVRGSERISRDDRMSYFSNQRDGSSFYSQNANEADYADTENALHMQQQMDVITKANRYSARQKNIVSVEMSSIPSSSSS
jgi:hypothetical protein